MCHSVFLSALYSKAKGQYLRLALPLHALFLQRPFPDALPRQIPEPVLEASIAFAKLCIQHTALLAGTNVNGEREAVGENADIIQLANDNNNKLQQVVLSSPGHVVSGSKMTLVNKFRHGGGKQTVLNVFNALVQKNLGTLIQGKKGVSTEVLNANNCFCLAQVSLPLLSSQSMFLLYKPQISVYMSHTTLAIGGHFPYMFTTFTCNESLKLQSVSNVPASFCNNIPPPVTKGLTQITYCFCMASQTCSKKKQSERIMLRSIETSSHLTYHSCSLQTVFFLKKNTEVLGADDLLAFVRELHNLGITLAAYQGAFKNDTHATAIEAATAFSKLTEHQNPNKKRKTTDTSIPSTSEDA